MNSARQVRSKLKLGASRTAPDRTCILVLGMHRSGTSAITRALSLLGAALPSNILGPGRGNESGHWEPERLIAFHDKMLKELGSRWNDWRALDLTTLTARRREEVKSEVAQLLKVEFGEAQLFILKDPRICRFVPLYQEVLDELAVTPRYVLPLRNPLEVVESLERRDGLTKAEAGLLWLRHVLDAEAATREHGHVVISYERFLGDWRARLSALSSRIKVAWPNTIDDIEPRVAEFLQSDLRHHARTTEDLLTDPMLRTWISDAYAALLALEQNRDVGAAVGELDRVRREFNNACPVISQLMDTLVQRETALSAARTSLAVAEGKAAQRSTVIAARETVIAAREKDIVELKAALTAAEGKARHLNATLARSKRFDLRTYIGPLYRALQLDRAVRYLRLSKQSRAISSSPLFDAGWYAQANPDVQAAGIAPIVHYILWGAGEGRDPSPHFNTRWYLDQNPDVAAAGVNPLLHYLNFGATEGRLPRPPHSPTECDTAETSSNPGRGRAADNCRSSAGSRSGMPRANLPSPSPSPSIVTPAGGSKPNSGGADVVHPLGLGFFLATMKLKRVLRLAPFNRR